MRTTHKYAPLLLIALGNSKGARPLVPLRIGHRQSNSPSADIVKMVESAPDLASQIRRVRGGYLKIQGTWMPYEVRSIHRQWCSYQRQICIDCTPAGSSVPTRLLST